MYLKSLKMKNFRKFREEDNRVDFVAPKNVLGDINVGKNITMVVGKNNSGKTTILEALNKLVNSNAFNVSDFNYVYLQDIMLNVIKNQAKDVEELGIPEIAFTISIGLDWDMTDKLNNIAPVMLIDDIKRKTVKFHVKWEIEEREQYLIMMNSFLKEKKNLELIYEEMSTGDSEQDKKVLDNAIFQCFVGWLSEVSYKKNYYNENNKKVDDFNISNLIHLSLIKANKIKEHNSLSHAFGKIIEHRFNSQDDNSQFNDMIHRINITLNEHIEANHGESINLSLSKILSPEEFQVLLRSDLSVEQIIKNVIKYEYSEGAYNVPEDQYGLGYTNLMMIIAEIMNYIEVYPELEQKSHINIISIEEPEAFMHPQLQEQFILNINQVIEALIDSSDKNINSQIIITSHSPHILNSKVHDGNSFDNINYVSTYKLSAKNRVLKDKLILKPDEKEAKKSLEQAELNYLKKHVSFEVAELFFSDAVIFVEGITEYTLLKYYVRNDKVLKNYHINIILINGSHAKVYDNLINTLNIPTLIITDLDIERTKDEKSEYIQIDVDNVRNYKTTNSSLKYFENTDKVDEIIDKNNLVRGKMMICTQRDAISGYYATSFEEAMILSNTDNCSLKAALEYSKPLIYKQIMENGGLESNSFKLQCKLSSGTSKSDFANSILMQLLDDDASVPTLPKYISTGFDFLKEELEEKVSG